MSIKRSLLTLFAIWGLAGIALANCPEVDQVTYVCSSVGGHKHCNWTAPWWEGYQGQAEPGDHPAQFQSAFWGASANPEMGSINCFYRDKTGGWVELSQNNWGGISKPVAAIWRDGDWPMPLSMHGLLCTLSPSACVFAYGAR